MKKLTSQFILLLVVFSASKSFAISDEDLAKECLAVGTQKIASQAQTWGCTVDLNQVEVEGIDNRWLNPSKYVWYQVLGECNDQDRIITLVQHYQGKCF